MATLRHSPGARVPANPSGAGKPTQNAFIESFNGKFRDECLNDHWFTSLADARILMAAWRRDYNQFLPHSALGYQMPAAFAANHRADRTDESVELNPHRVTGHYDSVPTLNAAESWYLRRLLRGCS